MRVLPYFQTILANRTAGRNQAKSAGPTASNELTTGLTRPPAGDKFIPSSPFTGVVYSIKAGSHPSTSGSGVVKRGSYSLYKLDGKIEKTEDPQKGSKFNLQC